MSEKEEPPCLGEMMGVEECETCSYAQKCEDVGMENFYQYVKSSERKLERRKK